MQRILSIVIAATLVSVVAGMAVPVTNARGDPEYCQATGDPRCNPEYCQINPGDPWCWDPHYCERNPDDPICRKEPTTEPKRTCNWSIQGADPNPLTGGARPGVQIVTLDCPNHILAGWECYFKAGRGGPGEQVLPTEPACLDISHTATPPCGFSHQWAVFMPNFNTATMVLRAYTWKDADCDGAPDDWNTCLDDGSCLLPNEYGPKTGWPVYPYTPQPDGKIDKCDLQIYEYQWRQFN